MTKGYISKTISAFEHQVSGIPYTVEAEVLYCTPEKFPSSRDDFYDDLIVEEIVILDSLGNDFSDTIIIEDSVLKKQLFVQEELLQEEDLQGLSIHHIASEAGWYLDNGL